VGEEALSFNNTGSFNTAMGNKALFSNTSGEANTAMGESALFSNTTGSFNTAIGAAAGLNATTGDYNVFIHNLGVPGGSNTVWLGDSAVHAQTILAGNVGIGTTSPTEKLQVIGNILASGTITPSDARLKTDVAPLSETLEKLHQFRGVSFVWNEASTAWGHVAGQRDIGVIAQEVEAVFPELVTITGQDGYKAVDYSRLSAVLIEAVKALQAEKDAQQQQIGSLEAGLAALEQQVAAIRQPMIHLSSTALTTGWTLCGALVLLGAGLRRRWHTGSQ
jgi:hypothetical protein